MKAFLAVALTASIVTLSLAVGHNLEDSREPTADTSLGSVDWWFDPLRGSICWIGKRASYGGFDIVVDLDGYHDTGFSSFFTALGNVGNYTAPTTWFGSGGGQLANETGTGISLLSEVAVWPPWSHYRFPALGVWSEWFHPFVTKRTPPTDWIVGFSDDDGNRSLPISKLFSVSFDMGSTWTQYNPASFTGPTGECREDTGKVQSPSDLKREAIQRTRALKEQALARGDVEFLEHLDEAEEHVWKSLGFRHPFRPASIDAVPASDVVARREAPGKVDLTLGTSWDARLSSYSEIRLTWSNGAVTVIDLHSRWPDMHGELRARPWVDAWHQDVRVHTEREKKDGAVTLGVHVHEASRGFTISLDGDRVADLSFTYKMLRLWIDETHLDPKHGHKVFDEERKAVKDLVCRGERDDDHDDDDDDGRSPGMTWRALDPRKWNDTERAALDAECHLIANLLVKADEILALVALQDAKDTPIQNPENAKHVQHEIEKSEKELKKAFEAWKGLDYADAIKDFGKAWKHAEHAIRDAKE